MKPKTEPTLKPAPDESREWVRGNRRYALQRFTDGGGVLRCYLGGHLVQMTHCWREDELVEVVQESKRT